MNNLRCIVAKCSNGQKKKGVDLGAQIIYSHLKKIYSFPYDNTHTFIEPQEFNKKQNYKGYQKIDYRTIVQNESDYDLVKKSLLDTPVIAKSNEFGWLIINVQKRNITDIATKTKMNDLERSYKAYASIQKEIDSLRSNSVINIDTTLFYEIAKLWSPTN